MRTQTSTGNTRNSKNDPIYELNEEFVYKLKETLVLDAEETEALNIQEERQVEEAVNLDRKAYIESVLYKTMKKEKQMSRGALLDAVFKGLIFPQTIEKVETCLQTLLLRGLLEEVNMMTGEDVDMEQGTCIKFVN